MTDNADIDLQAGATIASRGLQDTAKDAMARVGVMIEADAIKTDVHHRGTDPGAFPGLVPF